MNMCADVCVDVFIRVLLPKIVRAEDRLKLLTVYRRQSAVKTIETAMQ